MRLRSVVRDCLPPVLFRALRPPRPTPLSYIPCADTIVGARSAGMSVCDYVETLWNASGSTDRIMCRLVESGAISDRTKTVVEIGPGTGRYIEKTFSLCRPTRYEVYETAGDWREWIAKTYKVEAPQCNGETLHITASDSVDLIQAHGVFVYLPTVVAASYLREIVRVVRTGGYAVFDSMTETCFDATTVSAWLASKNRYPVMLSLSFIRSILETDGFTLTSKFMHPYGEGVAEYLIFRR